MDARRLGVQKGRPLSQIIKGIAGRHTSFFSTPLAGDAAALIDEVEIKADASLANGSCNRHQ